MNKEEIVILLATGKELQQVNTRLARVNEKTITMLERCMNNERSLQAVCQKLYDWMESKQVNRETEKYWKNYLKTVLRIK